MDKLQKAFAEKPEDIFEEKHEPLIIVVTGLSGAGKTSFMRSLEDINFYCVDNLPVPLLSTFLDLTFKAQTNLHKIALGIDVRGEQFLKDFVHEVNRLKKIEQTSNIKIIFLNANEETLLKRYQETRRNHPLAKNIDLVSAIRKEKKLLDPISNISDIILDTDKYSIHDLRHWTQQSFVDTEQKRKLCVNIMSFGFKYGLPSESNLVYDLRFLPNPHYIPALRSFTGLDSPVQHYVFSQPESAEYWEHMTDFLKYALQKFYEEGRFFVTVAIGCTGGKHRSTSFVEKLSKLEWDNITFLPHHRDLGKE